MSYLDPRWNQASRLGSVETPEVRLLPWDIDRPMTASEINDQRWERAGTILGVIGGVIGLVLSWRALRSKRD